MSLPISTFIKVNTQIQAGAGLASNFGMGLLLVDHPAFDAADDSNSRVRLFSSLTEVSEFVDPDANDINGKSIINDAAIWFSANPLPKNLYIGRWVKSQDTKYRAKGTKLTAVPSAATYRIAMGSQKNAVESADLTSSGSGKIEVIIAEKDNTFAKVANKLTSSTGNAFTFEYDPVNNRFEVTAATPKFYIKTTSEFGFVATTESKQPTGETAAKALSACLSKIQETSSPSIVMCGSSMFSSGVYTASNKDLQKDLAEACEAEKLICSLMDDASAAKDKVYTAGLTDSLADTVFGMSNQYSMVTYGTTEGGSRPDIGLGALLSSQNFNLPSSIITAHMKPLPGCQPTNISQTELGNLQSKRCNAYTTISGVPVLIGGYAARGGAWADAVYWLRWLQNEMELAIFNAQYGSPRFDTVILSDTIHSVMHKAAQTGGIARLSRFNPQITQQIKNITGDNAFDGDATHGYYVWVQGVGDRTPLDRENRVGAFRVWITTSDAIHSVTGDITLGS